jgi:hypothetical protein
MKPVKSSNINAVGYDPTEKVLHIEFSSGNTYSYAGVEPEQHAELINAESVGRHFANNILKFFKAEKV